ncbi:sedoheptulose 7-phosphate cyclase [Gloeocapsa sp. PCC 73106]|uniref:sedoheptulose 7-phosphate cyclase n=1 Tax=Gloeocapsa sp. PCC 73106 TaxID=102232 RepID=UPI0002AC18E7|nr:sedoheptulose 7-phosphate cyclase [Gloeocapsa sp. PCC 73106]ELR99437.1 3-dehydroquinate synthetase [Gloeocapsa sp. PCC 73106]
MVQAQPQAKSEKLPQKLSSLKSEKIIELRHDDKYLTSQWYTGNGTIAASGDNRSFKITASYTLEAEVRLVQGIFDLNNVTLAEIYGPRGRCVAIVDQTVDELYGKEIRNYFQQQQIPLELLSCRAWESDKTPETVHRLLHFLGKDGCDVSRNEPVLVIGGGVLSDVAGLACALQHRRTPYIMIGTTVVAAIDAGPSPRTCTNGAQFKNSIGAYHPPVLTLVDRGFFSTLSLGHIRNGMAEIIKMAVTDDPILFELMEEYGARLLETHFATVDSDETLNAIADQVIYRALFSYMQHEGTNMFETYQDRPHAYGHTWSPSFEPAAKLLHGHAVAIGMAFGASLATEMGWLKTTERDRIIALCRSLGLSVYHPILEDIDLMLKAQKNMRRKRGEGGIWAPLPTGIGSCDYAQEISSGLLQAGIEHHKQLCTSLPDDGKGEQMYLSDLGLE